MYPLEQSANANLDLGMVTTLCALSNIHGHDTRLRALIRLATPIPL